jgi:hypothetical protein
MPEQQANAGDDAAQYGMRGKTTGSKNQRKAKARG